MAVIPQPNTFPTLDLVDAAMERAQDSTPRAYLGVSQIAHPCDRALWYGFRWAEERRLSAASLRAIEDGHAGEAVMAARLRAAGLTLHTEDPSGQGQIAVESCSGHVRGHLDGMILGVVEAPKTWHVWEHKQVNPEKFRKLQKLAEADPKTALAAWDPIYYGQAVVYMGLVGATRHFLTAGSPGGREYVSVRTEANAAKCEELLARAARIIAAATPPLRLSDDPAWFECKWCPYREQCHGDVAPAVSCRTCTHSTPVLAGDAGAWRCERFDDEIPLASQREGCASHRYIPVLLERIGRPVDVRGDDVVYERDGAEFVNGAPPAGFTSAEIRAAGDKRALTNIPEMAAWRQEFGATVVG